jgi:hypothetical protein
MTRSAGPVKPRGLELDITRARRLLREHRERAGESLSFTAFVLAICSSMLPA